MTNRELEISDIYVAEITTEIEITLTSKNEEIGSYQIV